MALKKIFIPLSMLTMASLNRIEHNNIKFKCMTHGSGTSKYFLDEASFCPEDKLNDFKFSQAYTNWLSLIETVSDPIVEQGWHMHHKRMTMDHEFLDWAPAWKTHGHLLCTHFMLKPFVKVFSVSSHSNLNIHSAVYSSCVSVQCHLQFYSLYYSASSFRSASVFLPEH